MSGLIGVVVIARNGDRYSYHQDPYTFNALDTTPTPLGETQSYDVGAFLRETYLTNGTSTRIRNMHNDLADVNEVKVLVKSGVGVFDSAVATLQGLFPPSPLNEITLANGNRVRSPLGGYQYIPVETADSRVDRSLEGWTNCPNFEKHVKKVYESPSFKDFEAREYSFFSNIRDFIFGRPAELKNAWNIYDYVNSQVTHNQTYAFRLPPTYRDHARHVANYHANAVFSDTDANGIGNIAGRTLMASVLDSLQRISFNGDPHKFLLIESSYQPFISLFHQIDAIKAHPELAAIPDFGSALAIEIRRDALPDQRDFVRFRFKNGTSGDFQTLKVFGHKSGDIPLTEFMFRTESAAIKTHKQWEETCGIKKAKTFGDIAAPNTGCSAMLAAFILMTLLFGGVFAWKKRQQRARQAKLQAQQPVFEVYSDAKPVVLA